VKFATLTCGITFVTVVLSVLVASAPSAAIAPKYTVTANHLVLANVSSACPIIYDNDWWTDVPDSAYVWMKASLGKCKLRGNIVTRDCFDWEKGYAHKYQEQLDDCQKLLKAARDSGLRNIPDPAYGAEEALRRPESGSIEETKFTRTSGSDLIVAEAKRATPTKPLLIFVGGCCTTVATAYLTDPSIANRMVVFQIDGGAYNGSDGWAWEIAMKRLPFANWARGYFWDKIATWNPDRFKELPDNPLGKLLKGYAAGDLAKANQWGDGLWAYWLFSPGCLKNVEDYDGVAITVPKGATNVKQIEDEFFGTMTKAPRTLAIEHTAIGKTLPVSDTVK
jgi:hypothetical protein